MRKAEKRRLGRLKFEKDMAESKAHGLRMQALDRKRREQILKDAEAERAKNTHRSRTKGATAADIQHVKHESEDAREITPEEFVREFAIAVSTGGKG